ncbi:peroxiredoxin [Pseudalkalibacillus hwajinpoensis]|uniref:peroxiredoxin n=1 Tax=Guptibacillus hwajinpoensis TaxID=208199 RepID=UPI001CD55D0C|nr:peroxiredoxin [Pseudalkalibacillus hwajinpoensis]MCA0989758.1 peroxiredoxin [Pseudalkalibacillus hwajinpoensis]
MSEQQTETAYQLPRIGSPAPDFTANTTHGQLSLDDYKGKWFVLFSHPADFTPVCTTEFVAFQEIYPELRKLDVELIGLSVDSVSSHLAWVRNIEKNFDTEIEFPVIADLDRKVATRYGMIMPEESQTETSRAVFVVDDKQVVRAVIYYPLTTGRNMHEIMRLVKALKTTDEHGAPTPANWEPGDQVLVSPPKTQEDMKKREKEEGLECIDWYLCKKDLNQ